jgi:hypothetical protein
MNHLLLGDFVIEQLYPAYTSIPDLVTVVGAGVQVPQTRGRWPGEH